MPYSEYMSISEAIPRFMPPPESDLYETDFFQWTQETSDCLRRGEFSRIDAPALAEQVEDLGKRQKSALRTALPFSSAIY